MKRSMVQLLVFVSFAIALAGCKYLPASTVDNPTQGTPEWLVYKAIQAAQQPEIEDGWKILRPLLHSRVVEMRASEDDFINLKLPALHRKVYLFTVEKESELPPGQKAKPDYKLKYTEEDTPDKALRLFVINEGSDMPSPFRIESDPAANNEWRISNIP